MKSVLLVVDLYFLAEVFCHLVAYTRAYIFTLDTHTHLAHMFPTHEFHELSCFPFLAHLFPFVNVLFSFLLFSLFVCCGILFCVCFVM